MLSHSPEEAGLSAHEFKRGASAASPEPVVPQSPLAEVTAPKAELRTYCFGDIGDKPTSVGKQGFLDRHGKRTQEASAIIYLKLPSDIAYSDMLESLSELTRIPRPGEPLRGVDSNEARITELRAEVRARIPKAKLFVEDELNGLRSTLEGTPGANYSWRFLNADSVLLTANPATVDRIISVMKGKDLISNIEDSRERLAAMKGPLWQDGELTTAGKKIFKSKDRSDKNGHFLLQFNDPTQVSEDSLNDIATILVRNGLVGEVGVDLTQAEEGAVILTCKGSELALFTDVTDLKFISKTYVVHGAVACGSGSD